MFALSFVSVILYCTVLCRRSEVIDFLLESPLATRLRDLCLASSSGLIPFRRESGVQVLYCTILLTCYSTSHSTGS